jgi:hypothetical protein
LDEHLALAIGAGDVTDHLGDYTACPIALDQAHGHLELEEPSAGVGGVAD